MTKNLIPVIAIDGPSASGKGTVANGVAKALQFHYLDSGALYRVVAVAANKANIGWHEAEKLGRLAQNLQIRFAGEDVFLNQTDITNEVRSEHGGLGASQVSVHAPVRAALMHLQQQMRQAPGLVADGRDMASVVFTDAALKIFLTASVEIRAERRLKQYQKKGLTADYAQILADLQTRDLRDTQRSQSPLIKMPDAIELNTDHRNIEQAVQFVLDAYQNLAIKNR